jgi:GT2 family glycosyltransferase
MAHPFDLSICIINHQTPELTRNCLRSIIATGGDLRLEVLVVNNTPDDDGSFARVMTEFPGALVIQNPAARFFAANQNQMLKAAAGRYLLPLNSDTVVQVGALQTLVRFMDSQPRCGIAGPRLINADGSLQRSCHSFPGFLSTLVEMSGAWRILANNQIAGRLSQICLRHDEIAEVDWLTGACLIARREAVTQFGFFDDVLFESMYGEDADWQYRARQHGWQVLFEPRAVVSHLENQSPMVARTDRIYCGYLKFCAKHYPALKYAAVRMALGLALIPKMLFGRTAGARANYRKAFLLRRRDCPN